MEFHEALISKQHCIAVRQNAPLRFWQQ